MAINLYSITSHLIATVIPSIKKYLFLCLVLGAAGFPPAAYAQSGKAFQDSIRLLLASQPDDTGRVTLLNQLARSYLTPSPDSLLQFARTAIALAQRWHYTRGEANALMQMGIGYRVKGDYTEALNTSLKGTALMEALNDQPAVARGYLQTAQVYKEMSGPNLTDEYLTRGLLYIRMAITKAESIQDTAELVTALNSLGIFYLDKSRGQGKFSYSDTAFAAYTRALSLIEISGKGETDRGKLYNNIGQIYVEYKKDYQLALQYSFKAEAFNRIHQNIASITFNYSNIAAAYSGLHDHSHAVLYARKMLALSQELRRPERMQNSYKTLYQSFQAAGQMDSALHYYILAGEINDSLTNVSKTMQVIDLQTKYETARNEAEISRLTTETNSKNKQIMILIMASSFFIALASVMIWFYRRVKRQRQLIEAQSSQLEMMMKELHHRVKNNLQIVSSMLGLQIYKLQDEGLIAVLRESQQRVQAMSIIHQRLYKRENLTEVNMKEYLADLSELLLSTYGYDKENFDLEIKVGKEMMHIDQALPIGLIINEIATNSLKHAYARVARPSLQIILNEGTNQLICQVSDNGIGLDEKLWNEKSNTFGKQLIAALCKQLRARQSVTIDHGTEITIIIPKAA